MSRANFCSKLEGIEKDSETYICYPQEITDTIIFISPIVNCQTENHFSCFIM